MGVRAKAQRHVRVYGPAWRLVNAVHIGLDQMEVMTAIERCRTAALGGHVARWCLGASATPTVTARGWPPIFGVAETCTEAEQSFHRSSGEWCFSGLVSARRGG